MDNSKNQPIPLDQRKDFIVCLNCGLPNQNSDSYCMYCGTSLKESGGLFSWLWQAYCVLRWRYEIKQKQVDLLRSRWKEALRSFKTLGFFFLGVVLSGTGIYLFIFSIEKKSFSNCIVSIFFLLYGFYSLKTLFARN